MVGYLHVAATAWEKETFSNFMRVLCLISSEKYTNIVSPQVKISLIGERKR